MGYFITSEAQVQKSKLQNYSTTQKHVARRESSQVLGQRHYSATLLRWTPRDSIVKRGHFGQVIGANIGER